MNLKEKLDEIINRPDAGRGGDEIVAEILEACPEWSLEAVGKDEDPELYYGGGYHSSPVVEGRNELRSEIRDRLSQSLKKEPVPQVRGD